jgi:hypothetical protein
VYHNMTSPRSANQDSFIPPHGSQRTANTLPQMKGG